MAKQRKRKQQQVPGTERPEIESLTDAAEAYRKTVVIRMETQKEESEQKALLLATVWRLISDGEIEGPHPGTSSPVVVYRYEDEDGIERDVKFIVGKENVKVSKAEGADEE